MIFAYLILLLPWLRAFRTYAVPDSIWEMAEMRARALVATRKFRGNQASKYPDRFEPFIEEVLGMQLTENQREVVQAVQDAMDGKGLRKIAIKSCHGSGKTRVVAAIAIAFLHIYRESKVVTSGPGGTQVKEGLWQDIRWLYENARVRLLGRPQTTRWEIAPGWFALGYKPAKNRAANIAGIHAPFMLLIIDEGAELEREIYEALQGLLTSETVVTVMPGNPTRVANPFHWAFTRNASQWKRVTIKAEDTPNIKAGKTVVPGLITQKWVDDAIEEHGVDSDFVRSRVFAEFPMNAGGTYVPQAWIDRAEAKKSPPPWAQPFDLGLDVARTGDDETVLTMVQGGHVYQPVAWQGYDLMSTVKRLRAEVDRIMQSETRLTALRLTGFGDVPQAKLRYVKVDETGLGSGVVDRLRELKEEGLFDCEEVIGFNFGGKPKDSYKFANAGDEAWWELREAFHHEQIWGAITPRLIEDVTGRRMVPGTSGKTHPHLESKDDFKKRFGRSPDHGDSYAMAFWWPKGLDPDVAAPVSVETSGSLAYVGGWGDDDDDQAFWPT